MMLHENVKLLVLSHSYFKKNELTKVFTIFMMKDSLIIKTIISPGTQTLREKYYRLIVNKTDLRNAKH